MHARHKHTTSAWRNTHTPHTRAPTAPRMTIQTENTTSITSPTQTHNILQHSKAKNTIFNNGRYTTNIPTDPHTVTTTYIKTNMRHIHTYIVSRHLATRGNNKILRTPLPYINSPEEIFIRLTRRTLAQLRTKNVFLKSYLHKVDAKTHPSPLFPLCNTHIHNTHHLFNCTHIRTTLLPLGLWTNPARVTALLARWTEKPAGGPQVERSDSPSLQGSREWIDNNNILEPCGTAGVDFPMDVDFTPLKQVFLSDSRRVIALWPEGAVIC